MTSLSIHLHTPGIEKKKDKIKLLESLVGRPIAICIAPHEVETFSRKTINLIERILENEEAVLGQRGNTNKCRFGHKYVDPWHENWCPYHPTDSLPLSKQMKIMETGAEILKEKFGRTPEFYIAPNHLYDYKTEIAANHMRYAYFSVLALVPMEAWRVGGMTYLPEYVVGKNAVTNHACTHYDHLTKKFIEDIEIEPFPDIVSGVIDGKLIKKNREKVIRAKKLRDIIRFLKP